MNMLGWAALLVVVAVVFGLLGRLIAQAQAGDRRYGNPDDWDPPAGDHS